MTLQQMEYVLAVDRFRHFAKAAEHCRVTQPTLSAMIQKLEEELGTKNSTGGKLSLINIREPTRPDKDPYAGFCMEKKKGRR